MITNSPVTIAEERGEYHLHLPYFLATPSILSIDDVFVSLRPAPQLTNNVQLFVKDPLIFFSGYGIMSLQKH